MTLTNPVSRTSRVGLFRRGLPSFAVLLVACQSAHARLEPRSSASVHGNSRITAVSVVGPARDAEITFADVVQALATYDLDANLSQEGRELQGRDPDPRVSVPAIYGMWISCSCVTEYWKSTQSRMTRVFLLALFFGRWGSGGAAQAGFPRFDVSGFPEDERIARLQEIAFVKAHSSAIADALVPILKHFRVKADIIQDFEVIAGMWDGNPLPGKPPGKFTKAILGAPPAENDRHPVEIVSADVAQSGCDGQNAWVLVKAITKEPSACRAVVGVTAPGASIDSSGVMAEPLGKSGAARDEVSQAHELRFSGLPSDEIGSVTIACRVFAKVSDVNKEPVWRSAPRWGQRYLSLKTAKCK